MNDNNNKTKENKVGTGIVRQGDCLAVLSQIPDNSVDLVCTDPPY
jgi:predicted methyltransferase